MELSKKELAFIGKIMLGLNFNVNQGAEFELARTIAFKTEAELKKIKEAENASDNSG